MGETKELNIKNQTCYFDDIIDITNFHSNLFKIDKKSHKDTDLYYIGYITIKRFGDCEYKFNLLSKKQRNNKAKDYYKNNKERLKEQPRKKYRNLSEEEKNIKREYEKK